ncbi:MAG: M56 family metallopeptidase [Acidobacteriota bacterium]|jgi:TonB family protein
MSTLWTGVITHLWQTTLVLALIAALATLLRRAPARYIEGMWTVALLKLLVPLPLLGVMWPALKRLAASFGEQRAVLRLSQLAYPEVLRIDPAESAGASATYPMVAAALWVLGTTALLVLWWRRARVPEPAGEVPWHASDDIVERVGRAARSAGVPLSRIRITDAAIVPCVGNFRRPMVLLPRAVVQSLREDELHAVLVHEEAHRRRGDLWRGALQRLTICLFYFYPPAWWLTRRLRAAAEMACDEAVLATGIDARTYARALARTVVLELDARPVPALASGRSHLRARLQRIQKPEDYGAMRRHVAAVAVAVVAAVGLSLIPIADGLSLPATSGDASGELAVGAPRLVPPVRQSPRLPGEQLAATEVAPSASGNELGAPEVPDDGAVAAQNPYRVGGDIEEPQRVRYVAPEYPELARRARMEGFVILQAVIDRDGNVQDAEVLRGLGLGLDTAALDAVRQWKYTPTYYKGRPVEVILTVNVVFQLIQ